MTHNEKKGIFIVAAAGLVAGLSFGFKEAEKDEIRTILNTNTIRYENAQISSGADQSQIVVDKDGKVYVEYKDENGNGIPDELEELVGTKKLDNVMTITLTSAMNACLNIITFIYGLYKWKHLGKTIDMANSDSAKAVSDIAVKNAQRVTEIANTATENVKSFSYNAETISNNVIEQQKVISELSARLEEANRREAEQTEAIQALKQSNEDLNKGYRSVSTRLDAILANQELTADSADNVRMGISSQIHENVKGAKKYGQSEDSAS